MNSYKPDTSILHSDYEAPHFGSLNTPIYHASTITFPNVAAMRARDWRRSDAYTYGLQGTPTTYTLEQRIAELEGASHCLLVPSGLAAISLVNLALLKSGDEVLLPDNVYGPSRDLGNSLLADWGITTRFYNPLIGADIAAMIQPATRLVWFESPGSVTMEVPDIPAMLAAIRLKQTAFGTRIFTAIDNTWAAGVLFRPFDYGIDISMHALTKYPSGGSDVLMGSVTTNDHDLHLHLKRAHSMIGFGVGGDDAFLVLRGLNTMNVRLRQSERSALELAHWLKTRPEVNAVLHPAFADCPGHEVWKRDFSGASGLFSVTLRDDIPQDKVDALIDSLRLFRIGFSWGGVHSLAVPYIPSRMRTAKPWTGQGALIRFYVGLEDVRDLIAELQQAFHLLA